jgi:hypothetical protein
MWPWEHAAIGYLLYVAVRRARGERVRDGPAVVGLAVGTQFPDLIDKTLAWYLGVLPSGRSLGHSVLTLAVVGLLVRWYARRRGGRGVAGAFLLGYASHLPGDAFAPLLAGEWTLVTFLGWPLLPLPDYAGMESLSANVAAFELSPTRLAATGLVVLALVCWRRHGYPGLGTLRGWAATHAPGGRAPRDER